MRAMNCFMTPGGPARALHDTGGMILGTDDNLAGSALRLKMALQAKVVVALDQHFVIHTAVRVMTCGAAFTDGFVFEDEWSALWRVALHAGVLLGEHGDAAA